MAKKKTKKSTKRNKDAKPPTKTEVFSSIADKTDLSRRDVAAVFNELQPIIKKSLRSSGSFNLPGLCKMTVRAKPRVPAGERLNPFTGETAWRPAKPASKTVKIRPLKQLKEMV